MEGGGGIIKGWILIKEICTVEHSSVTLLT